jgi:tetratricopeptide (TPR) repeat protein
MSIDFPSRKGAAIILATLVALCLDAPAARGEPMCPLEAFASGNGRYLVGVQDHDNVFIWDIDRLWDRLQPTQVHGFKAPVGLKANRNIAVSHDGARVAFETDDPDAIVVHAMAPGFARLAEVELSERGTPLVKLSPDGSELLVVTKSRVLLAEVDKEAGVESHPWTYDQRPIVDWGRREIAVLADESIQILKLDDLTAVKSVPAGDSPIRLVAFAGDGGHVIASAGDKLRVYYIGSRDLRGRSPVVAETAGLRILGASSGDLWYVETDRFDRDERRISPATASGERQADSDIVLFKGRGSRIVAISRQRDYALVQASTEDCGDALILVSLSQRLPSFELYGSRVNYRSKDLSLPHLTPRLGSDPLYEVLQRHAADAAWSPNHGYHFTAEGTRVLLWTASLAAARRDRHDLLWFDLLSRLEPGRTDRRSYLRLDELTSSLLDLKRAEHLLDSGSPEEAVAICQAALAAVPAETFAGQAPKIGDMARLSLDAVVSAYWPVLEAELRLTLGHGLTALGRAGDAERVYRQVLTQDPQDWRAHAGLLVSNFGAEDATFDALLAETQAALRLEGWSAQLRLGYPTAFFEEQALRELRRAARAAAE